ncbi:hypothetical protein CRG98_004572 [Punica granatum]|uniref:Retrotransposon gag domain-containing protein n=1 Tax=Punica granatum TaxID=22663 RepID=A0A2I0L326_PUNGR|nr:hypothetical protein CRG98_004572 [Punica granatum]
MDRSHPCLRLDVIITPAADITRLGNMFRPADRAFLCLIIGDLPLLADSPIDWTLYRTAISFWDTQTILFPYSSNLIDGTLAQVILQLVGGHSYVEAVLAETNRSLDYLREKDYPPKRILTFNGSTNAEEYLAWISDVDRFFDYYGIPDDGSRVVRVVYRLRGKASTWWEKLENNRLQDGRNLVFTWRRMKQLLNLRFFPLGYEERLYESEDDCMKSTYPLKHGKTNAFPMTIVDVEEKVQLEEASMKGDKFKEEKVESKNEAAQASQDNNVPVEKDLAIGKILREELISNSEEKV